MWNNNLKFNSREQILPSLSQGAGRGSVAQLAREWSQDTLRNLGRVFSKDEARARPKILYYSHNMEWQGAPNSLLELAVGVQRDGKFEPVVMTASDGPLTAVYGAAGISQIPDPRKGNPLKDERKFEAYLSKLTRQFRRVKPCVVHANTLQSFHAVVAAKRAGIPVVFNVRESENPNTYFDFLPEPLRPQAYETYNTADKLVFVSQTTQARWESSRQCAKPAVIQNGIDVGRLMTRVYGDTRQQARLRSAIAPDDIVVLSVGTLCERKGQLDILYAISKLPPAVLPRLKFHFFGSKPNEYAGIFRSTVESVVKATGVEINVFEESRTEKDAVRVAQAYLSADLFILSSRLESYPRTILEALSFSLPVISTRCFGALEMVEEGKSGYFYDTGDAAELSDRLARLASNDKARREMAKQARERFSQLQSYDRMLAQYQATYADLMAKGDA
ncbi:MAG: glycosyltransferase family 4 protein [Rhizobiales bacterium]|nr:glycosyltransferase family 4 protein [Hyphomicrobiales bacterium]